MIVDIYNLIYVDFSLANSWPTYDLKVAIIFI